MRSEKRKVFLVNDTYLYDHHFGCEMVSATFREQFCRTGLEMIGTAPKKFDPEKYRSKMDDADLIVINGEGSMHSNNSRHLLEIAREYPAVLVNSVFQDNDENASLLENFRYIAVRESRSADYVRAFGFDVDVVPDVIFASAFVRAYTKNAPVNDIGMSDSVFRQKFRFGPFKWKRAFGFPAQCSVVEYLKMLESYRRLCIGRFHGVVLASMLGIPFSSWESNTWKISGLMRDMGAEHLHFATQRDAVRAVPCVFPLQIREFVDAAPARIERMFDHIASLAKR